MKKRILSVLLVITMLTLMVACAKTNETGGQSAPTENSEAVSDTEQADTPVSETIESPEAENNEVISDTGNEVADEVVHEHEYAEEIVVAATCTESGTVSYTCECGDTYSEEIEPTGHDWGDYASNGDATYFADGTKTAVCASCGETDTVPDDGSKLAYTYTDCEAVKYAQQTVNVRSGPSTDFDKVGSLSTNQEVAVTGTCNETGWYRIVYGDGVAYVSNKYLGDSKVEVSAPPADNGGGGNSGECPYPLYQIIDEGGDNVYFYRAWDESKGPNWSNADYNASQWNVLYQQCAQIIASRHGWDINSVSYVGPTKKTPYYIDGYQVLKQEICVIGPDGTMINWNP